MKWATSSLCQPHCVKVAFACLCLLGLPACTTWQEGYLHSEPFDHQIVRRPATAPVSNQSILYIYLHGDGQPFITPTQVAADPSPQRPYVLSLMAAHNGDSVLLGRPCYFAARSQEICHPKWWTSHRYAEEVVNSLSDAANLLADGRPVVLIGFSGGGSLAMLIAPDVDNLVGVVTIAANLDVTRWAVHHGYTPLSGSLDPLQSLPRTAAIPQIHYFGGNDEVVPISLSDELHKHLPSGSLRIVERHRHDCCWQRRWAVRLQEALAEFSTLPVVLEP